MNRAYSLLNGLLIVGSAPYDSKQVRELDDLGVDFYVNLTCPGEVFPDGKLMYPYWENHFMFEFPILDKRIPSDKEAFYEFINEIISCLVRGFKIYLHCRGGHGRAGLAAACILQLYSKISPEKSLALVQKDHDQRKEMSARMRKLGSPQTQAQKKFVMDFMKFKTC